MYHFRLAVIAAVAALWPFQITAGDDPVLVTVNGVEILESTVLSGFHQKLSTDQRTKLIRKILPRVVTNEVQFYESGDLGTVWNKLRAEGVADFAISPGNNHSVAVFIPERKVNTKFDFRTSGNLNKIIYFFYEIFFHNFYNDKILFLYSCAKENYLT